jgi:type VI secretion system protein VasJ
MGTGLLNGWEDHWDLLPFACERTWNQIEYLAAFAVNDLKKFELEVQQIRPPHPGWPDFEMKRGELKEMESQIPFRPDQPEFLIDLKMNSNRDHLTQVCHYHSLIRSRIKTAPNAIFIGGTLERTWLSLFRRPLQSSDFVQLWSVSI